MAPVPMSAARRFDLFLRKPALPGAALANLLLGQLQGDQVVGIHHPGATFIFPSGRSSMP